MRVSEEQIEKIVQEVLAELKGRSAPASPGKAASSPAPAASPSRSSYPGVFERMEDAVLAAAKAYAELQELSLEQRRSIIEAIRETGLRHAAEFASMTVEETGMGRVADKIQKFERVCKLTPGVEDIEPRAWSGDYGLTVDERAPFGVIGAILPSTHPMPTMICNAIGMIAAGNAVAFNPHPTAKKVSAYGLGLLNQAMMAAGAPANLITTVFEPGIETAQVLFTHPDVRLLCVTGGPAVVAAAMSSRKKVIAAGPANPPVVIDETADLALAARSVVEGASFDNNLLCIGEKVLIPVEKIADQFKTELRKAGGYELTPEQMDELAKYAFVRTESGHLAVSRDLAGRDPQILAAKIGIKIGPEIKILFGETRPDHPWVEEEQMMPCLPVVRVKDVDQAIEFAFQVEHGYQHTSIMHSMDVRNLTKMGQRMGTTIFVKNGPSGAGLGVGGEGTITFSIAGPTGEGITTPRTFTRLRRCAMVGNLNIVRRTKL